MRNLPPPSLLRIVSLLRLGKIKSRDYRGAITLLRRTYNLAAWLGEDAKLLCSFSRTAKKRRQVVRIC